MTDRRSGPVQSGSMIPSNDRSAGDLGLDADVVGLGVASPRLRDESVNIVRHEYALEQLFSDQERDLVVDAIPSVLAWVPGLTNDTSPFVFPILCALTSGSGQTHNVEISLSWDEAELERLEPSTLRRAARQRTGRTPDRERVTENAGYGLAMVAISILLPGRRVVGYRKGQCPDLLFDDTPGKIRGVEAAARTSGGVGALSGVKKGSKDKVGKVSQIRERSDVVEGYLSLWCAKPRLGDMMLVKP